MRKRKKILEEAQAHKSLMNGHSSISKQLAKINDITVHKSPKKRKKSVNPNSHNHVDDIKTTINNKNNNHEIHLHDQCQPNGFHDDSNEQYPNNETSSLSPPDPFHKHDP